MAEEQQEEQDQEEENVPKVYCLVSANSIRELEEEVNQKVLNGWMPTGFHSIERGPTPSYYQPMVRASFLEHDHRQTEEGGVRILNEG